MVDLPNRVASLSPEQRAALVMQLKRTAKGAGRVMSHGITRRANAAEAPLSFAQQRLWFLHQLDPANAAYQLPLCYWLRGRLEVPALERSLNEIVRRHEVLRTVFMEKDGVPMQMIRPSLYQPLPVIDLSSISRADGELEVQRWVNEEAARPFNLEQGPLLRTALLKVSEDRHAFSVVIHHIVTDGLSMDVFMDELIVLYEAFSGGATSPLAELPLQYGDFCAWQREQITGKVLDEHLAYWREQLGGELPSLELPTDRPRPLRMTYSGADEFFDVTQQLTEKLNELSRREGASLYMTLLAAFLTLLHRYTRQDDIIVGAPIAGRNQPEVEKLIGFFVNTLVLRTRLSGDPTFRELLGRVRDVALGAYEHQDVPFEKLVEELQPERSMNRQPFFQITFNLQNAPAEQPVKQSLKITPEDIGNYTRFDLEFHLWAVPEGIAGPLLYNTDLFDRPTIQRMLQHFHALLEGIVSNPEARLSELPLLSADEREQLREWSTSESEYPRDQCVHELVALRAAQRPEAPAVSYGAELITYRELNERANQLSHYLRGRGVGLEVRVGVLLERSVNLVVGLLAILKAGGVYVPLDGGYPIQRLRFMLEDAGVGLVLTESGQPEVAEDEAMEVVLDQVAGELEMESRENPECLATAEGLAYVMYTSGSTGQPKGVAVTHRAISRLVCNTNYVKLEESARMAQVSNVSFDASTFEIWGALLNGGHLIVLDKEVALSPVDLSRALVGNQISAMFLTTALFNQMAQSVPGAFASLRYMVFGGDAGDAQAVRRVLQAGKPQHLLNGYGPTEATTFATWYEATDVAAAARTIPIGRPLSNSEVWVLDEQMQMAPVGVFGELYIGGDGLARCYLRRPELTAEKFVPHPYSKTPGARLYRTGDLVRYLNDGQIEFLKRMDQQVKVRGFRVEPGEIEAALQMHPAVCESVVIAREDLPGDKQLTAYVLRDPDFHDLAETQLIPQLRRWLQERLPPYLVPSHFLVLEAFPLTPNGKIDRRALPAPNAERLDEDLFVAPRTPEERRMAEIWEEVLDLRPISAEADFFELGGHSLLATRIISRVREVCGIELPLRLMFDSPTVAALARHLTLARDEASDASRIEKMVEMLADLSEDETQLLLQAKPVSRSDP